MFCKWAKRNIYYNIIIHCPGQFNSLNYCFFTQIMYSFCYDLKPQSVFTLNRSRMSRMSFLLPPPWMRCLSHATSSSSLVIGDPLMSDVLRGKSMHLFQLTQQKHNFTSNAMSLPKPEAHLGNLTQILS